MAADARAPYYPPLGAPKGTEKPPRRLWRRHRSWTATAAAAAAADNRSVPRSRSLRCREPRGRDFFSRGSGTTILYYWMVLVTKYKAFNIVVKKKKEIIIIIIRPFFLSTRTDRPTVPRVGNSEIFAYLFTDQSFPHLSRILGWNFQNISVSSSSFVKKTACVAWGACDHKKKKKKSSREVFTYSLLTR